MKKIIELLEKNNIDYKIKKFGCYFDYLNKEYYFDWISINIPATEKGPLNILELFEKANRKKYHIEKVFHYGFNSDYHFKIFIKKEYQEFKKLSDINYNYIETFWKIYHEKGKEAAERYYDSFKSGKIAAIC